MVTTDGNYGREAPTPGTCTGAIAAGTSIKGIVPWVALGIPEEAASDGYLRRFSYFVTLTQTNLTADTVSRMRGTITLHSDAPIGAGLPPAGNQINSCSATAPVPPDNSCNLAAAVVLVSHGENGLGAFLPGGTAMPAATSAREVENADANDALVRSDYSNNPANSFDDIVLALNPDDLLGALATKGSIASARSVTNDQLRLARDIAIAAIGSNAAGAGKIPATLAATIAANLDGWGRALVFVPRVPAVLDVCGETGTVFSIASQGSDGVSGVNPATTINDDITLSINAASIKPTVISLGTPCL